MLDITLTLNTKNFERALHLVPEALKEELKDGLDHAARKFLKEFRARRLKGPPGIRAHPRGIFTHFHKEVIVSQAIEDMEARIYSDSKIAKLHEEGGKIRGQGGGSLAVPLSARAEMFTKSGQLRKKYKDIRNLPNVIPLKFGEKIFLVKVKKRSREVKPLFVLKKEVTMKPRMEFYETFRNMTGVFIKILNTSFERAIDKAWRFF